MFTHAYTFLYLNNDGYKLYIVYARPCANARKIERWGQHVAWSQKILTLSRRFRDD